ncbi:hypothetical protein H257_16853 [Aphanomyces astaci]|uniref:Uncharacterized protein n=1 Tax=Aphanomyces astaci TaxID=112090 RepID=W4FJ51_APHAT|nr:hypothetical protein H257_16853 [Aphanomyces astaci]ETV66763.1 hypothetical protein H257_16853 [Aphanomyces astaci]|eukprot:XP_009843739.1 hypothetical protein H257_16853 [Aphanomyces astaci]
MIIFERQINLFIARFQKKHLTWDERRAVVDHLLLRVGQPSCKLQLGAISDVARLFGRLRHTIAEIWKRANVSLGSDTLPTSLVLCNDIATQKKSGSVESQSTPTYHRVVEQCQ